MKIYADTANINEIKEAYDVGLADGVTTNPSLIAKESGKFTDIIASICNTITGPVHVEVLSSKHKEMVKEAMEYSKIASNIVIKIPMTHDGLETANYLKTLKIKTNITLIFSAAQAILAAKAGATYICPFLGRVDDMGYNGLGLLKDIRQIQKSYFDNTFKIIAASIRTPEHVTELTKMGIDILTIPTKVIKQMEKHPLTDIGIIQFEEAAKKFKMNNE